ncbi:MAG: signal recognition particle protein [Ignavibacteria bacterium]|nr:signal recognition particle protein [Ignavibacteria bacterium]
MFEDLSNKLETVLKKIRGQGKISEKNIEESLREIRRVLFDADVNYKVVGNFLNEVKKKSLGQNVINSITPGQLIVKIIYDELIKLMGSEKSDINFSNDIPSTILIVGLQGSGKTTFSVKLAGYLKSKGKAPLLAACDIYRPAAIKQLEVLGKQIQIPVYSESDNRDAIKIAQNAIIEARKNARDTLIIDTAGRLSIDEIMMNEVSNIKNSVKPAEILFVVDSMTGQDAVNTAKVFHEKLDYDGVILTKLDGDTKGGAALSIKAVADKPIKFVSTGEKLNAIEPFYPDRMASRILGMGDIVTFVEKAQQEFDLDEAAKLEEKYRKNIFDFNDYLTQIRQIKKMGSLSNIVSMLPGVGSKIKESDIDEKIFTRLEAIILSMTEEERESPSVLNGSRRRRIANGSGTSIQDVNKMIKQYDEMKKMMKGMNTGKMKGMMKKMNIPANFLNRYN